MKIIHLGHIPVPDDHPEKQFVGSEHPGRWALNLALAQKSEGQDVTIVSQAHKARKDFECIVEGIPVRYMRSLHRYRHFFFYFLDSVRIARAVRAMKPDILVVHGTEDVYGHAAIRSKLPFCILAQGLFYQIIPSLERPPTLGERFLRLGEDMVWKRSHFAVAVSRYVGESLSGKYPHLDITQIPLTYEPALDVPLAANHRGQTLAFVGSLDERKGLVYLVDAIRKVVRKFPSLVLHVCGNPDEKTARGYTGNQLQNLRTLLGQKLVLHGKVTSKEVFAVLRRSTALVAPSLNEMFGCQLVEALMCGAHGIVTDDTAMAENVRIAGNGTIVPKRDSNALAEAIMAAFSNPPSLSTIERSRSRLREYLGPKRVAKEHILLYRRILSTKQIDERALDTTSTTP